MLQQLQKHEDSEFVISFHTVLGIVVQLAADVLAKVPLKYTLKTDPAPQANGPAIPVPLNKPFE